MLRGAIDAILYCALQLNGNESNKVNISDPNSKTIVVNPNAVYVDPDPGEEEEEGKEERGSCVLPCLFCWMVVAGHSVQATQEQVFGNGPVTQDPAPMNGFVQQGMHEIGK
jgi:phospholipase C